ncbi:hypothetical protein B0H19DRAFT_1228582 [Mycena capillaripes]|nr:hypothetical protein B0H19DRAFT_1228582 [Mycena capillaripes]
MYVGRGRGAGRYQRRHTMSEAGRMVVVGKREGRGASVTAVKLIYGNCDVIDSAVFGTNYRALLDDSRLPPESSQAASRLAFLASAWDSFGSARQANKRPNWPQILTEINPESDRVAEMSDGEIWLSYPRNGVCCHYDHSGVLSRLQQENRGHGTSPEVQSAKFGCKNSGNLPKTRFSGQFGALVDSEESDVRSCRH